MHDRAVRAGAGDRVEAQVAQSARLAPERFEPVGRVDLGQRPRRCLDRQPVEEARQRRAVTLVRAARARLLDRVLHRFRQHQRVAARRGEYQQALAAYKGAFTDFSAQRLNRDDAREIYKIIKLQYDEGIKTYLEVIVAENDLRTAQLNYYNALYNVLATKLDVQRAMGNIPLAY